MKRELEEFFESKPAFVGGVLACLSLWLYVLIALLASGCGVVTEHPPVLSQPTATPTPDFHPSASATVVRSNVTTQQVVTSGVGVSYYGMSSASWNCSNSLDVLKDQLVPRVATLNKTFGDSLVCLERYLADPRPKVVEVHLMNETCWHDPAHHPCGPYELLAGIPPAKYAALLLSHDPAFLAKLRAYVQPVADLLNNHLGNATCYISPGLESNLPAPAAAVLFSVVKPMFPKCRMVWSPIGTGPKSVPGMDVLELHGDNPQVKAPCITNEDGVDLQSAHTEQFLQASAQCDAAFLWPKETNCLGDKPWSDPRLRTECPSASLFAHLHDALVQASKPPEPIPPWNAEDDKARVGCKTYEKLPASPHEFTWKQSDANPGAAIIFPVKFAIDKPFHSVTLNKAGKIVNTCKFAGPPGYSHRQIWRCVKGTAGMPYNSILHADSVCWILKNPKYRID